MLKATLTKNVKANGFELRLHETVDKRVWSFLCNEMGMNWVYSKTEKTEDGKRQVILYRSFDMSKPQNKRKAVKYTPEKAYALLLEKTASKAEKSEKAPKAKAKTAASKASRAKTEKPASKAKTASAKTAKSVKSPNKALDKMTKAELIALLASLC